MVYYKLIGRGTTDSNGLAHMTHDAEGNVLATRGYKGKGNGKVGVVASPDYPIDDSSKVSNTCEVTDCQFYDDGINVNSNWNGQTPVSDGTGATFTATTNRVYVVADKDNNAGTYDCDTPSRVEFELLATSGSFGIQTVGVNNELANQGNYNQWLHQKGTGFWKMDITATSETTYYKQTENDEWVQQYVANRDFGDKIYVRFLIEANSSFKFRNFKFYPI